MASKKNKAKGSKPAKAEVKPQKTFLDKPLLIQAGKYLAAKGVKPHHRDAMIVFARNKGFTGKMTVAQWAEVFESY
jgi:hypothetical protein